MDVNIFEFNGPRAVITFTWWVIAAAMSAVWAGTVAGNTSVLAALRRLERAPSHYEPTINDQRSTHSGPRAVITFTWWVIAAAMSAVWAGTVAGNTSVLAALRRLERAPSHYEPTTNDQLFTHSGPRAVITFTWWVIAAAMSAVWAGTVAGNTSVLAALRRLELSPSYYEPTTNDQLFTHSGPRAVITFTWWVIAAAMSAVWAGTVAGNTSVLAALRRLELSPSYYEPTTNDQLFTHSGPRAVITFTWWVIAAAMSAVWAGTVAGNTSVLAALRRLERAPSHYPLASLAVADLLVGVFVLPIALARELFVFRMHWLICACWSTLDVLCCTASILSLCLLGWERWRGITAPLARARRARQARLYAALIWPVSAAVALPTAFVPSHAQYPEGQPPKACIVNTNVAYACVSSFFSFFLPASIMLVMYVQILRALAAPPPMPMRAHRGRPPYQADDKSVSEKEKRNNTPQLIVKDKIQQVKLFLSPSGKRNLPGTSSNRNESHLNRHGPQDCLHARQKRASRTIVTLMALFLFCWTPFFVILPLDSVCECVSDLAWQLCPMLGYLNSALNPIVYAASSPSVRKAIYDSFSSRTDASYVPR